MSPFPHPAQMTETIRGSVFSALAHRLHDHRGEVYPFHVGDTWLEPVAGARMEDLKTANIAGIHRYSEPRGRAELLRAIATRVAARTGCPTTAEQVFVTAGATAGLYACHLALLEPGDEVLVLAPYWPLIEGIIRAARGVPVAVSTLGVTDRDALLARLESLATPRTVALYFSSPNNPTGRVLPRPWLEALVAWTEKRNLWVIADEVYEDYVYRGQHHSARPLAPERTIVVYSFSKAYGMTGNRCGYLVGPEAALEPMRRLGTHTFYSTSTSAQLAGTRALELGDGWLATTRAAYREIGNEVAATLGIDPPEGGTFLFLDLAAHLDQRGLEGLLLDCASHGLFLAPGPSFGLYPTWARLCFTAAPPAVTRRGAQVLAQLLAARLRDPQPVSGERR